MNPDEFNQYRSETLWPEVAEHLEDSDKSGESGNSDERKIETVLDYLNRVVDEVPNEVKSWCDSHSESRHIFTRYYPYTQQPVTLLLSNPRLDYDWDDEDRELAHIEDDFPTLEHRRYAVTEPGDIESLSRISAEHYNGYLYNKQEPECLLKRLGTVTETLDISNVVQSLPEEDQWSGNLVAENSGVDTNDEGWRAYFYDPDATGEMYLKDINGTSSPEPREVLEKREGVTGADRGLWAQSPDMRSGLYSDMYITNTYKLGSRGYPGPTDEEDHIEFTVRELKKAGSDLVIASGIPAQKVLFRLGDPVYDPKKGSTEDTKPSELLDNKKDYQDPTDSGAEAREQHYGVIWKLDSGRYGLAVPHMGRFNSLLGGVFNGELNDSLKPSDLGWRVLSDSLNWLGERTAL